MSDPDSPSRYQPVVPLFGCSVAGAVLDRMWLITAAWWFCLAVICLAAWFASHRSGKFAGAWLLLLSALATTGLWHHVHWRIFSVTEVGFSARVQPAPLCAEVVALSSPRRQPAPPPDLMNTTPQQAATQFPVEFVRIRNGKNWREASGRAMVRVNGTLEEVETGDTLRIVALYSGFAPPLNPGEPDFGFYQRTERRLCKIEVESPHCVRLLKKGSRWRLLYWLNLGRDDCERNLLRHIPTPRAGLAAAVLLGTREQIDQQRTQEYMASGTIHLLSISGLHVGILAYGFWWFTRLGWLSRTTTLVAAMVFVLLYAVLTEARPPVVRASVLVLAMCGARLLGRQPMNLNTLATAGLVVFALNPCSFFQTGTQLSFMAVATMAALPGLIPQAPADPLDQLLANSRPWWEKTLHRGLVAARKAVLVSTAIWIVALPLVAHRFHLVSPIATILNPVVCVPMAISLFAGVGVILFSYIAPPMATACGWLCDANLLAMEWLIAEAIKLPGSFAWVRDPPQWWIIAFYVLSAIWLVIPSCCPPRRWLAAAACAWLALGSGLTVGPWARQNMLEPGELRCTFVAVGHGTSVLLELPDGRTVLYDAGRLGMASSGARSISAVLWSRRISHLDAVVISHADADHFNAIPTLLNRFSVGRVYVSPVMFRHASGVLDHLRTSIMAADVRFSELARGDTFQVSETTQIFVLLPPPEGLAGSDNANSLVFLIEHAGCRILLPGDLETPGLEALLAGPPLHCDVVMAPHHGSAASHPADFIRWCSPETVVVSGGGNRDPHQVVRTFESQGARVLHTARDGAVEVRIRSDGTDTVDSFMRQRAESD